MKVHATILQVAFIAYLALGAFVGLIQTAPLSFMFGELATFIGILWTVPSAVFGIIGIIRQRSKSSTDSREPLTRTASLNSLIYSLVILVPLFTLPLIFGRPYDIPNIDWFFNIMFWAASVYLACYSGINLWLIFKSVKLHFRADNN
jgi:hypothetical protein